jgi:hypothetical protein
LKIRDETFEQMEIALCPKCSEGNKAIVEDIVSAYNLKANLAQVHSQEKYYDENLA